MQHGVFGCSEQWVVGGPGISPALMLADNGYDVWLTNSRGNDYSKKHENLTRRDPRFWMFSWHEMGVYDIPASIDYILNATQQEKLFYVGHSMGNSVFFVAMGLRPEYNAKIRLQLSFGPSAFFHGAASAPLRIVTANADYIKTQLARQLERGISSTSALVPWHYTQILRTGRFHQMDRGAAENLRRYGSARPPDYPLRNVTAPVALYVSEGDFLVPTKGVIKLSKVLPNVVSLHIIKEKFFNHMDFFYSTNMKKFLMNHVLDIMQRF